MALRDRRDCRTGETAVFQAEHVPATANDSALILVVSARPHLPPTRHASRPGANSLRPRDKIFSLLSVKFRCFRALRNTVFHKAEILCGKKCAASASGLVVPLIISSAESRSRGVAERFRRTARGELAQISRGDGTAAL